MTDQDPTPQDDPTPEPDDTPTPDDDFDRDRAMHTIKTLRDEARAYKKEAKRATDLEAKLKQLEDAEKTELARTREALQELKQQQASWEQERRASALRLAVHDAAGELGVADVDLAIAALDRDQVEYDDNGKPSNVNTLLSELLERKPILKTAAKPKPKPNLDSGAGGDTGQDPGAALTATEIEWATRLGYKDPADYQADKNRTTLDDFAKTA